MSATRLVALSFVIALGMLLAPAHSRADGPTVRVASFALVLGVNKPVDTDLTALKYADDDAARYFDLFRLLGARTYLLSRLDENTRRIHPQVAAEAEAPVRKAFDRAVTQLARDLAQASSRGVETVVYLVYAGHGSVTNGQGYITLEDSRITGAELSRVIAQLPATHVHVIVDACASYFLAYGRGPGGKRRTLEGFRASALADDPRVGFLLSTSSARESHEWDVYQSGVFSHEVRSGLYGAADADRNGEITYREMAAFISRANAAVPNERFRPDVHARAPRSSGALLDIRSGLQRRLVIEGERSGHYFLEDARGVRVADVNSGRGQSVALVRPSPSVPVYLRSADDEHEFLLDPAPEMLALADLSPNEPRARARGAAHESFSLLFTMPFDRGVVDAYREPAPVPSPPIPDAPATPASSDPRRTLGIVALGVAAAGIGTGTYFSLEANSESKDGFPSESQAAAAARNGRIGDMNTAAAVSFIGAGAAAGAGIFLLLFPSRPAGQRVTVVPGVNSARPALQIAGRF